MEFYLNNRLGFGVKQRYTKNARAGIVMEDLKGIRKRIRYGRQMNRRLHSWNFRMLQFYIDYKAKLAGLNVVYVNPRGTSSLCPICGERLAPNGHRLMRCRCGYENDRDVTACVNMLRMRGAPLPLKAINEDSNRVAIRDGTDSYITIRQRNRGKMG